MRKGMMFALLLCAGCLQGCMPTEKSEQERWRQANEIDQAERESVRATMAEHRKADSNEHAAISQQITKEHTIQTPDKMDALAAMQAQFAAQAKAITDAAMASVALANKAADDRTAVAKAENAAMPKNPMLGEAGTAILALVSSVVGAFTGVKIFPPKTSSEQTKTAIAALNAKVGLPVTT